MGNKCTGCSSGKQANKDIAIKPQKRAHISTEQSLPTNEYSFLSTQHSSKTNSKTVSSGELKSITKFTAHSSGNTEELLSRNDVHNPRT